MEKMRVEEKVKQLEKYNKKYEKKGFSTRAIHYGQPPDPYYGSVNTAIHMSSTYIQHDCNDPVYKFDYTRGGNPTRDALEMCVASLENAKQAWAFSSGMSASSTILHLLSAGDHIISIDDVYGGTGRLFRKVAVPRYNMEVDFIDMDDPENIRAAVKENTKVSPIKSMHKRGGLPILVIRYALRFGSDRFNFGI